MVPVDDSLSGTIWMLANWSQVKQSHIYLWFSVSVSSPDPRETRTPHQVQHYWGNMLPTGSRGRENPEILSPNLPEHKKPY